MGMNRYRNHKCLMDEDGWEWLIWPYSIAMLAGTIFIMAGAANSAPLTRKGAFCPIGYYRTSAYCMPLQSTTPPAVPRTTETCPIGTYTQSNYCVLLERAK